MVFVAVGSAMGSAAALGAAAPAAFADTSLGPAGGVTGNACNTADGVSRLADGVSVQGGSPQVLRGNGLTSQVTGAVRALCQVANPPVAAAPGNVDPQTAAPWMVAGLPLGAQNA
jgi:hypothetical protein